MTYGVGLGLVTSTGLVASSCLSQITKLFCSSSTCPRQVVRLMSFSFCYFMALSAYNILLPQRMVIKQIWCEFIVAVAIRYRGCARVYVCGGSITFPVFQGCVVCTLASPPCRHFWRCLFMEYADGMHKRGYNHSNYIIALQWWVVVRPKNAKWRGHHRLFWNYKIDQFRRSKKDKWLGRMSTSSGCATGGALALIRSHKTTIVLR